MEEPVRCTCGRYMAWHVKPDTEHNGEKVYERQTTTTCGRCRRAELRIRPALTRGRHAKVELDDLVQFIEWGYHPDELARRFGYTHRENIYVRLRRSGRQDLVEKLIVRVQEESDRPIRLNRGAGRDRRNAFARAAA